MPAAPAFQFYASDWAHSVSSMTLEERGAHITLLAWSWENGPIPEDRMPSILGVAAPIAKRVWIGVSGRWRRKPNGTWINKRLEATRRQQRAFSRKQAEKGRASGRARAARKKEPRLNHGSIPVDVRFEPETNSPISDLRSLDQHQDQEPRADARRVHLEFVEFSQVRTHLKAAAHAALDDTPDLTDGDLAEVVKTAAAKCRAIGYSGREITKVIDAVRGERARRHA